MPRTGMCVEGRRGVCAAHDTLPPPSLSPPCKNASAALPAPVPPFQHRRVSTRTTPCMECGKSVACDGAISSDDYPSSLLLHMRDCCRRPAMFFLAHPPAPPHSLRISPRVLLPPPTGNVHRHKLLPFILMPLLTRSKQTPPSPHPPP